MTSCISKCTGNCRVGRGLAATYVLSQPTSLNQQSRNGSQMPAVLRLDHGGMSLWLSSAGRLEELLYRGFIGCPSADGRQHWGWKYRCSYTITCLSCVKTVEFKAGNVPNNNGMLIRSDEVSNWKPTKHVTKLEQSARGMLAVLLPEWHCCMF